MNYDDIKNGNIEALQKQLDQGARVDKFQHNIYRTPLHIAC